MSCRSCRSAVPLEDDAPLRSCVSSPASASTIAWPSRPGWRRSADATVGAASSVTHGRLNTGPALLRGSPGLAAMDRRLPRRTAGGACSVPMDLVHRPLDLGDVGSADLVPTMRGRPLGSVPAVAPGAQWDWEDVVERLTDAVLGAGGLDAFDGGAAPG